MFALSLLLALASPAHATVGFAEWSLSTPSGSIVCHCDNGPTGGEGVVVYDPLHPERYVRDVEDFKIYREAVVGSTSTGDFFIFQPLSRSVRRFARHDDLDAAVAQARFTSLGQAPKGAMVWGAYALAAMALAYGLFSLIFFRSRKERPVERRVGMYVFASVLTVILGALSFILGPYTDWTLLAPGDPFNLEILWFSAFFVGVPALIGVGVSEIVASLGSAAVATLAPRLRVPSRWAWLLAWGVVHVIVLRAIIGTFLLHTNPYWRGDF